MQSRRDQVQAHQFVVSRLTTGLLRADPDEPETPIQRTSRGVFIGALLGAVASVGFLVYGFVSPGGSTGWREPGSLVMEKETGTWYFYDGTLRPVRNYTSVRLLGGPGLQVQKVSTASLTGTAHGGPIGIEGAPDALPAAGALTGGKAWEVCAATRPTESGGREPTTSLRIAADGTAQAVPQDRALLIRSGDTAYLVWRGNRFRVTGGRTTLDALGYGNAEPYTVSSTFVDALPAGPDLVPPATRELGKPGPRLDGRPSVVGSVFTVSTPGSAQKYFLLRSTGLVPVTTTQAALVLGDPDTRKRVYRGAVPAATTLSVGALDGARAPASATDGSASVREAGQALPPAPPAVVPVGDGRDACVRLRPEDGRTAVDVVLAVAPPASGSPPATAPALEPACTPVDAISVPPSGGSLVKVLGAAGTDMGNAHYLITDTGIKYRIPTGKDAETLGYDLAAQAHAVPSSLIRMVPTGPDLSPAAAAAGRSSVAGTPQCGAAPSG
ncbi:type VII secretion protein EccB [Streptomyces sp. NPDC002911]